MPRAADVNNEGKRGNCAAGKENAWYCKVRRNCNISQHDATRIVTFMYYICHGRSRIDHVFFQRPACLFRERQILLRIIRIDRESSSAINRNRNRNRNRKTTLFKRITFNWQFSVLSLCAANVYLACFTFILARLSLREIILPPAA